MNIVLTVLLIIAGISLLLLIVALLMKKQHYVKREIVINAAKDNIFSFLRLVKNQDRFNKWAKTDPNRKEVFKGIDGTEGYVYAWSGNKSAGEGEKEITRIVEGERIETEIRFIKPMRVSASVIMITEAISDNQTKVSFINTGTVNYPLNLMIPVAEKNFAKDLDSSLQTLKKLMEQ